MTGKQVIKRLEQEGWVLRRVRGSHHIMTKGLKVIPVPVHGKKELGKGILHAIAKDAGWL